MQLRPWEFYRFTESEFYDAMEGAQLAEQKQWEKIRLLCLYAANGDKMKPVKSVQDIMQLPAIDGQVTNTRAKRIEQLKKEAGL